jgi:hypothetical protein
MVILQITFFLTIFIALLFGSHYFLYFSLTNFFSFFSNHKGGLIASLAFLATSFILTSLLAHAREDIFTRTGYFLSGFWLGLLTNLTIMLVLIWFLRWILPLSGLNFNIQFLAGTLLMLAFLISIYGTWNAFELKLKNITVTIPNLPKNWQGKKIVQLSDVHLGIVYQKSFLERIVTLTNSVNPAMVIITGDLFDGTDDTNLDNLISPLNNFKSTQGTFFVNGNHETYLGTAKVASAIAKTQVKLLSDEVVDLSGLKLIGLNYPERDLKKDVVATLQKLAPQYLNSPNILLYHSPTNITDFADAGINLQLSGHTHLGQIFPFNFITKLIYHGYDYGLHEIGNYTLYTTSGIGTWGPTMRTNSHSEIVVITLEAKIN